MQSASSFSDSIGGLHRRERRALETTGWNRTKYDYDERNRLKQWTRLGATEYFGYDSLGNLTHRSIPDPPSPTNDNQKFADADHPHWITEATHVTKTYTHDQDGNLLQRGGLYNRYTPENWLECVGTTPGGCQKVKIRRNVDGVPYQIRVNGQNRTVFDDFFEWDEGTNKARAYIYAFGRKIAVATSTNATLRLSWPLPSLPFDPRPLGLGLAVLGGLALFAWLVCLGVPAQVAARPVASTLAFVLCLTMLPLYAGAGGGPPQFGDGSNTWVRRWITHDHLGSGVLHSDAAGVLVQRRVFEPFGMVEAASTPTEETRRLFTDKRYEQEAEQYDFGARSYDPEIGSFGSVDLFVQSTFDPQTHNAYAYTGNNPTNRIDPTGSFYDSVVILVPHPGLENAFVGIFVPGTGALAAGLVGGAVAASVGADDAASTAASTVDAELAEPNVIHHDSWIEVRSSPEDDGSPPDSPAYESQSSSSAEAARAPGQVYVTGHRVGGVGPYHTALEYDDGTGRPTTLSAEGIDGKLTSNLNRPTDAPGNNITLGTVTPPAGASPGDYFSALRAADAQYCDCFDYDVFPGALPGTGYNSNSYVSGLIRAAGGVPSVNLGNYYGGATPLPPGAFRGARP